jgi:hypothetical protein
MIASLEDLGNLMAEIMMAASPTPRELASLAGLQLEKARRDRFNSHRRVIPRA